MEISFHVNNVLIRPTMLRLFSGVVMRMINTHTQRRTHKYMITSEYLVNTYRHTHL